MSELKCPFCQQELQEDVGYDGDYSCPNCRQPYFGSPELWQELIKVMEEKQHKNPVMCVETRKIYVSCTEAGKDIKTDAAHIGECISGKRSTAGGYHWKLVSIIDAYNSTRKALDKAKWWLNEIVESHRYTPISTAEMALKEITALEQKDHFANTSKKVEQKD